MSMIQRLRSRPGLSTALGAAFAIMAGLMLLGFVTKAVKPERGGRLVTVPVAARDIAMGAVISKELLSSRSIPVGYLVPGTLRKSADVEGARALRFIGKGEPVTAASVAGGEGGANLASKIPDDLRAYSIELSRAAAGCSQLRPGDRVDVLYTRGDPPATSTLLSGRLILSLAGVSGDEESGAQTEIQSITLLVSPQEAELLAQAASSGEISVSLCPGAAPKEARTNG